MFPTNLWLFLCLVFLVGSIKSLPHIYKEFKCAGDNGQICDTGLCYDSLGFYEGGQNVGCAQPEMCTQVGCFMYKGVFTCCCANRFCNGKTEMLMMSKYERFKQNKGAWPIGVPPRIFARNITIVPANTERSTQSDVRLAPPARKTTTSNPSTTNSKSTNVIQNQLEKQITAFEHTTQIMDSATTANKQTQPMQQTSTITSTTTKIATFSSKPQSKPLVIEQEVKLTSQQPKQGNQLSENSMGNEETTAIKDSERTTRSYNSQSDKQDKLNVSTTTTRPRKQKQPKNETKIEKVKATHREESYPKSFPWYAVTIVGFIISSIIFAIVFIIIKKWRQRKTNVASNDSINNASSVDSSRISDAYPNEHGHNNADPLLAGKR